MTRDRNEILLESIKRLLRRGATKSLQNIVRKTHAADLSIVFRELSPTSMNTLFNLIKDIDKKVVLLSELEETTFLDFVKVIAIDDLVQVFEQMPADDAAELLGWLDEGMADEILKKMKKEDSRYLRNNFGC